LALVRQEKLMKKIALIAFVLFAAGTGFIGCGKKNSGSVSASGPTVSVNSCQPGQVFSSTYGCLDQAHCQSGYGWVPSINSCQPGTPVSWNQIYGGNIGLRFGYHLERINRDNFAKLMREYGGFCDRYNIVNFWNERCTTYAHSGYVIIQATNQSATEVSVTIGAGANSPNNWMNPWLTIIGQTQSFQMMFRARVYPINNNTGVEIRAYGLSGVNMWNAVNDQSLIIYAQNNRLVDNRMETEVYYRGGFIGSAPVERY